MEEEDEELPEEEPMEEASEDDGEEVAVEPVVDPDALEDEGREASIDMVLFGADSKNPHWSVFADGKPVAEINLSDQPNAEEIRDVFTSDEYPEHVQEACASSLGLKTTLDSVNARWYYSVAKVGHVAEEAREAAAQDMEEQFAERLAHLKEDLLNTINLAITASNKGGKGLFVTNTLKQQVAQAMREAGVANPSAILNEIWVEAAQKYMQDVLQVSEKWLGYSPEAMHEVTAEVMGTEVEAYEEDAEPAVEREARAASRGMTNVPLRTSAARPQQPEDFRQSVKDNVVRGLGLRMGSKRR